MFQPFSRFVKSLRPALRPRPAPRRRLALECLEDRTLPTLATPVFLNPFSATSNPRPTFQWTSSPGATSYQFVLTQGASTVFVNSAIFTNSFTPTSNLAAGTYSATVQAANVAALDFSHVSSPLTFSITPTAPTTPTNPAPASPAPSKTPFQIGVARPNGSGALSFSLDTNGKHQFDSSDPVFTFGLPGDIIVTGDWNGDGRTKLGVARPNANGTLTFSLDTNGDGVFDAGDQVFSFGLNGDRVITGDWTGDGRTKLGVVRPNASGALVMSLDAKGNGVFDASDPVFTFGLAGDQLITGDWTGNGKTKLGVARPNAGGALTISLDAKGNGAFDASDPVFVFGLAGDQLITGDWSGDGKTKLGAARPDTNGALTVSLDAKGNGMFDASDPVFTFGRAGDTLVAGKFQSYANSGGSTSGIGSTDGSFDAQVVISNVKGTYRGTLTGQGYDANDNPASLRGDATLVIDSMTDTGDHRTFNVTGSLTVNRFFSRSLSEHLTGVYTLTASPTTFTPQSGHLAMNAADFQLTTGLATITKVDIHSLTKLTSSTFAANRPGKGSIGPSLGTLDLTKTD
jgi:hypothetical protein